VDYLKTDLSSENFKLLQETLPKFNRIKLVKYPSKEELATLNERLKTIPGVLQVEAFTKSQTTAYTLLSALKAGAIVYAGAVFLFTLLLFAKYMEVWRHEHIARMRVMALFGAPVWMRSMALIKMALISSIISVALAIGVVYMLAISPDTTAWLASVGLPGPLPFDLLQSLIDFAIICVTISIISIGFVAFQGVEE
jgi:cell division transport system permease protein